MVERRPFWLAFVPGTGASYLRRVGYAAPLVLCGVSLYAVNAKQAWKRHSLADESEKTTDRIERRAYVVLPDGRSALVHPRIDTSLTPSAMWNSMKETFSLLP